MLFVWPDMLLLLSVCGDLSVMGGVSLPGSKFRYYLFLVEPSRHIQNKEIPILETFI